MILLLFCIWSCLVEDSPKKKKKNSIPHDVLFLSQSVKMFREAEFFAEMVVSAVESVRVKKANGAISYPIKAINILKQHGRSARESELIDGYALNCTRASQGSYLGLKNF